ncbi:MAG: HAMP domain-containing sensor histidine kinase [Anaerolineaceae bacterium]
MKTSLNLKLVAAFILVAVITGLVLTIVFRSVNQNRFDQFVLDQQSQTAAELLTAYYQTYGSWDGVEAILVEQRSMGMGMGVGMGMGPGGQNVGVRQGETRRLFGLADPNGKVLVGVEDLWTEGYILSPSEIAEGVPLILGNQTIGTLLAVQRIPVYNAAEQLFINRTNRALVFATIGAVVLAGLLGAWIARGLTHPLRDLTVATKNLAQGLPQQAVKISSRDELGELGEAFNKMSHDIETSNQLRRQMTADVAHDLRTPLTVIGGYVEAIRDGALDASPERMELIADEVEHLNRMVAELRLLSQADAGELKLALQTLDPAELLTKSGAAFALEAQRKGILLTIDAPTGIARVQGDESRLMQVLENLLANAFRHTPAGGQVSLGLATVDKQIQIKVSDTGEGIAPEELPYVFERFHRGDKSRHTDENQSGLGLAIVKAIVNSHGGSVSATSEVGKGTSLIICLPKA